MAGGGGTRLWPLSRRKNPKQFLDLGSGKTLLAHTFDRAKQLTSEENIFIATSQQYFESVKRIVPTIPVDNIFIEYAKRDTAAAFAAAAVHLEVRNLADEPTIFMWSDHIFTAEAEFMNDLQRIPKLVENNPDTIVIMGHIPTAPETNFGYIETGERVTGETDVFQVTAFKEKPNRQTAEQYLLAGKYFWNMAYISTRPRYLLQELRRYEPGLMEGINAFKIALTARDIDQQANAYEKLPKIAIDYALLERTQRILAITGDYGWNDVGNWAAVKAVFGLTDVNIKAGHHAHIDSANNYVYNATSKVVSLIGIHNTVVIVTDDAILVADEKQAHRVKEIVENLEKAGQEKYL